jgi:hypothetical protein
MEALGWPWARSNTCRGLWYYFDFADPDGNMLSVYSELDE